MMKTPVQELMEYMEQNQYFIGNDLLEKYNELIEKEREMKITLEYYDHTCGDGCCYTTGYDVFVDGKKIGHTIGEDAQELADLLNETFNTKDQ